MFGKVTSLFLHVAFHHDVLASIIASDTAGNPVTTCSLAEGLKHGLCAVVVADLGKHQLSRQSIDASNDDHLEFDEFVTSIDMPKAVDPWYHVHAAKYRQASVLIVVAGQKEHCLS